MLYTILKFLIRIICKLFFFVKIENGDRIPQEGASILAVSHVSFWDPVVLLSCTKRPMRTMAKKELFRNKLLAVVLKMAGAFPVDRGTGDITAIKTALKALKDGKLFTIFPAGTRVKGDEAADAKAGVALIASRSGVPVIPIAMRGGYRLFHRVTIAVGNPMTMESTEGKKPTGDELKAFADRIMQQIESLGA